MKMVLQDMDLKIPVLAIVPRENQKNITRVTSGVRVRVVRVRVRVRVWVDEGFMLRVLFLALTLPISS
jgi:hypothetical protein